MGIKINFNELNLLEALKGKNPSISSEDLNQSIFLASDLYKLLDADKNGTVTTEEINKLYEIDNGDKVITDEEISKSYIAQENPGVIDLIKSFFSRIGYSVEKDGKIEEPQTTNTPNAVDNAQQTTPQTQANQAPQAEGATQPAVAEPNLVNEIGNFFADNGQDVVKTVEVIDLKDKNLADFTKIINENPELRIFFNNDKDIEAFFNSLKTEGGDKLTENEIKALTGLDGDDKELSVKDIQTFLTNKVGKDEYVQTPVEQLPVKSMKPFVNNGGNTGSSGVNSAANKPRTKTEIESDIKAREGEITNANNDAATKIADIEKDYDIAVKDAMAGQGLDETAQKDYQDRADAFTKTINEETTKIQTAESEIQTQTANVDAKTMALTSVEAQLSSLNSSLSGIVDSDDPAKNEENKNKRNEINTKISRLEEEKEKLKQGIEDAKTAKDKAIADKDAAIKAKTDAETAKNNILQTMSTEEKYKNFDFSAIQSKIQEMTNQKNQAVAEVKQKQQTELDRINKELAALRSELILFNQKDETAELLRQNSYGDGQGAIDFAKLYDGMTQAQMAKIFEDKGYNFHAGAWCADFTRMALYEGTGRENLPEWYQNSANPAYCPTLYKEASDNGAIIDIKDAKPGDMVLFDWDDDGTSDHVGILVSNGDGVTIKTIEGNTTSNSKVASRERNMSEVIAIVSMRGK